MWINVPLKLTGLELPGKLVALIWSFYTKTFNPFLTHSYGYNEDRVAFTAPA